MSVTAARRAACAVVAACLLMLAAASRVAGLDLYQPLDRMHHTAWTAKDGLTGHPTRLAQTTDGYLWVGTSDGLYRFDGVTFERYEPEGGPLPAVSVSALLAVPDGGLWVGYSGGGATFIGADGRRVDYTLDHGLPFGAIRSFARDHDGVVWLAAVGGLARLEKDRWQIVRKDWNYPCLSAWKLFVERDGTLWVGAASPDRILYLPKGRRRFEDTGLSFLTVGFAQTGDRTVAIADWLQASVYEVRREGKGTSSRKLLAGHAPWAIAFDRDGGLWVPGRGGLARVRAGDRGEPAVERFTSDEGLSGRLAVDVFVDREGSVWTLSNGGVDRFRRRNLTWNADKTVETGASLVRDGNGDVWVLSPLQPSLKRADTDVPVRGAPKPLDLGFADPDGSVWLSTLESLLRWSGGRFTPVPPPPELIARKYRFAVGALTTDRARRLWVSVIGLGQFHRQDDRWTFVPILPDRPDWTAAAAHTDAADRVWLAYGSELARVDRSTVRLFTRRDGLDVGNIRALGGRDHEVWAAGERGLAFLLNDRFHAVHTASGPPFGVVGWIATSRDGLWLNAAAGIVHIPASEVRRLFDDPAHRVRHDLFDLVSDLPDALMVMTQGRARATAVEDDDGVLWFLTNNGLARLDPRQIVRNPIPPPVAIRAVTADDKAYSPRGTVSLPALTRTIRIDYTALSLAMPERVRFRYRLEGWESDWHDAGTRRTVFYTGLAPGRYAFRVLACNNDGVWNETGAALAFQVAPAWYQTTWFRGVAAAGLAISVATLYRLRLRRISAALSARFDERLAERTRIARELHDTLLQTVQGSKLLADVALEGSGEPDRLRGALERLSEWLGRAVHEGRAALNSLRASTIEANDLMDAFKRAADDSAKPAGMAVTVGVRGESRELHPIVRDEVYRIGYEAIRNAYAHSRATRLDVAIEHAHDLTLRITDNGTGIDPAIAGSGKHGRFGLPGMRERAANVGATLTIVGSASGTSISLTVPGGSAYRHDPSIHLSGS